jgi:hypothetical protein
MLKFLALFFIFSSLISSQVRASDFIDGCYKTLEVNGKVVPSGPEIANSQSSIYSIQNEFYYDLETKKSLKTKVMSVFRGFNGGWYSFTNALMFEDLGTLEVSDNSIDYTFNYEVFHRNSYYALNKVDFKTEIHLKKFQGIVVGTIKQASQKLDRYIDLDVVLKEAPCAEF